MFKKTADQQEVKSDASDANFMEKYHSWQMEHGMRGSRSVNETSTFKKQREGPCFLEHFEQKEYEYMT